MIIRHGDAQDGWFSDIPDGLVPTYPDWLDFSRVDADSVDLATIYRGVAYWFVTYPDHRYLLEKDHNGFWQRCGRNELVDERLLTTLPEFLVLAAL